MEVIVNGKPFSIRQNSNVIELLDFIKSTRYSAVFINDKHLLFSQYNEYILEENDNIRVIRPLGGG